MIHVRSVLLRLIGLLLCLHIAACQQNPAQPTETPKPETQVTSEPASQEPDQTLPVILFASGSTRLDTQARRQLREIAFILNQAQARDRRIYVYGHSDTQGDANTNLMLSRQRAEAVSRELMLNGVKGSRLEVFARGESEPLFEEEITQGEFDQHAADMNRRVEVSLQRD